MNETEKNIDGSKKEGTEPTMSFTSQKGLRCLFGESKYLQAIGQEIKKARKKKRLQQQELAKLIGLSPSEMSVIESGQRSLDVIRFFRIMRILEIDPVEFITGEPASNESSQLSRSEESHGLRGTSNNSFPGLDYERELMHYYSMIQSAIDTITYCVKTKIRLEIMSKNNGKIH